MNRANWPAMFTSVEGFLVWSGCGLVGRPIWIGLMNTPWTDRDTAAMVFGGVMALTILALNRLMPGEKVKLI